MLQASRLEQVASPQQLAQQLAQARPQSLAQLPVLGWLQAFRWRIEYSMVPLKQRSSLQLELQLAWSNPCLRETL
jgi:hypothetical protein